MRSMTGYGRGVAVSSDGCVSVELRSLNHRHCEINLRTPKYLLALEGRVRQNIKKHISRGRIEVYFNVEKGNIIKDTVNLDLHLASSYYQALRKLGDAYGIPDRPELSHFLALPGIFSVSEAVGDVQAIWPLVEEALEEACQNLVSMRLTEGQHLGSDLRQKVLFLQGKVNEISAAAPAAINNYRENLRARVQELLMDATLDETRVAQEVAVFAERVDITEEIVRLQSHINQLMNILETKGAVGRKMDFLVQEINREINTIGAKAQFEKIGSAVIEFKGELERIREQIQNIE